MPDRFATILTCIDGRVQGPLHEWARTNLGVDFVDTITEPGPCSAVAVSDDAGLDRLLTKVRISQDAHGSKVLVIAGHSDCAGNPVPEASQRTQLRDAVTRLSDLLPGTRVIAVHAGRCGEDCWSPSVISEATSP